MYTERVAVYCSVTSCVPVKTVDVNITCVLITSEIQIFNFNINQPDTLYVREQGYEDPWLLFEAKRGSASKKFWGKTALGRRFHNENSSFLGLQ